MTPTATATVTAIATATPTIVSWPNVCRGCSCQWQNGSRSTRGAARRSVVRLLSNRAGRVAVVVAKVFLPFSLQVFHVSRSVSLPKCLIPFIRSFSFDKNVNSNVFNVCVPFVCLYTPKYETVNCKSFSFLASEFEQNLLAFSLKNKPISFYNKKWKTFVLLCVKIQ